ncbi:UNVERIFIED_CONTAM: hypothetical protein HDU68_011758 [Siphonaria sp. JEL0065]|nr:hypothetical protein HDU68_011758 [Siphonaria sp. JEL0065]
MITNDQYTGLRQEFYRNIRITQIPICGPDQNLPALSDRNNYPYYWRVTFSNRYGEDIATLLKLWKVGRVAMVFDADDIESTGACLDIKNTLFSHGVIILANRHYHGLKSDQDYADILNEFQRVDARYMILCAQAWSNSYYLVETASKMGLIDPKYAWFATQPPYPPDYSGIGDDSRLDKIVGMIYPAPYAQPRSEPNFVSLSNIWLSRYNADPMKYQTDHYTWTNEGTYDCTGTLLFGFDKLLKNNPQYTVNMLATRQLQDKMNYSAFKDTGFNGTLLNPMKLDDYGDVAANTVFTSLNSTFWINGGAQPVFAEIDKATGAYIHHFPPTFYGGGSIPPPDGPPNNFIVIHNSLNESQGKGILGLFISGVILILVSGVLLYINQNAKSIKANNPGQLSLCLIGSLLCITSIYYFLNDPTPSSCHIRIWLSVTGLCLIVMPLIMKNLYIYKIVSSKISMTKQQVTTNKILTNVVTAVILAIEVALLAVWHGVEKSFIPQTITVHEYILQQCVTGNPQAKGTETGLYVVNSFILIAMFTMAYLNRNVNPIYNESSFLMFFSILLCLMAFLILGLEVDETLVIKQCACLWIVGVSVPLFLLGPKYLEFLLEADVSKLKVGKTSVSLVNTSTTKATKSARKAGRQSQTQSITISSVPVVKSIYKKAWINIDLVYRAVYNQNELLWPTWRSLRGVSIASYHQKVWIMCSVRQGMECFPLLENTTFEAIGTVVTIKTDYIKASAEKKAYNGYRFHAEFKKLEEAQLFIQSIKSEIKNFEADEKKANQLEPVVNLHRNESARESALAEQKPLLS